MYRKVILLDIDGVLVTTPGWKPTEMLKDGFSKFNEKAAMNLSKIIRSTSADIILTTSHRKNYSLSVWKQIMKNRSIQINDIQLIDEFDIAGNYQNRLVEITEWVRKFGRANIYVIIDDDTSLDNLPLEIKKRWVKTKPLIGLNEEATNKVLQILNDRLPEF